MCAGNIPNSSDWVTQNFMQMEAVVKWYEDAEAAKVKHEQNREKELAAAVKRKEAADAVMLQARPTSRMLTFGKAGPRSEAEAGARVGAGAGAGAGAAAAAAAAAAADDSSPPNVSSKPPSTGQDGGPNPTGVIDVDAHEDADMAAIHRVFDKSLKALKGLRQEGASSKALEDHKRATTERLNSVDGRLSGLKDQVSGLKDQVSSLEDQVGAVNDKLSILLDRVQGK